jgi:Rieske Fe-S protein
MADRDHPAPELTDGRPAPAPAASRRAVLRGMGAIGAAAVGIGALAACGSDDDTAAAATNPTKTVKAADIPVGGGVIYPDAVVVVTQPVAGNFRAFSAMCMHLGCVVNQVDHGKIICPCHGSEYSIADGSVYQGPSTTPLNPRTLTVSGDTLTIS